MELNGDTLDNLLKKKNRWRKSETFAAEGIQEQYHGLSMILGGFKTYLDLRKPNDNGFILENITRQMIRTH